MSEAPLVSCLMVTEGRLAMAERALRNYATQTWPNRELVLVSQGDAAYKQAISDRVRALGVNGVRLVFLDGRRTLGALRNVALDAARGEILCLWDDDDVSHPDRIRLQVEHMQAEGARACMLTDRLHWFVDADLVFWTALSGEGLDGLALNTLVAWRDPGVRYPETGPFAARGEDAVFVHQILQRGPVARLRDRGDLYLYACHGTNTYATLNHRWQASRTALPVEVWPADPGPALTALAAAGGISAPRPGGPEEAAALLEQAEFDPGHPDRRHLRAHSVLVEHPVEAIQLLQPIVDRTAQTDLAWFDLGTALLGAGRLDEAREALQRCLALRPDFPEVHARLGDLALQQGAPSMAETAYEHALRDAPHLAATWGNLGIARIQAGRVEDAHTAFLQAAQRAPEVAEHLNNLQRTLSSSAPEVALQTWRDLATRCPWSARVAVRHGALAARTGHNGEALAAWARAADLDRTAPGPLVLAAELSLRLRRPRQANALIGRAMDRAPARAGRLLGRFVAAAAGPAPAPEAPSRPPPEPPERWERLSERWGLEPAPPGGSPIFLLATGWRSGSTLLQRLLTASGEVWMWGEPYGQAGLLTTLRESLRPFGASWPLEDHVLRDEDTVDFTHDWVANLSPHPRHLHAGLRAQLDRLFADPARARGLHRWGLKEVRLDASDARFLAWLYPDARFVFLVRNPWDAWASYRGARWYLRWPDQPIESAADFAALWARLAEGFVDWADESGRVVRYEDLVGDAPDLEALARHLHLEKIDPAPLAVRQRGIRQVPTPPEGAEIRAIYANCGPIAARLGYHGPEDTRPRPE